MTTETTALVRQMREAMQGFLNIVGDSRGVDGYHLNGAIAEWDGFPEVEAAESAIAAADQWLAQPPTNQCGETCERAKLCAVCARGLEEQQRRPLTDDQIREVLLSASRDAAVKLGVPADELGEPDEDSLHSATMAARWVEPAMAAAWGVKLED